MRPIQAYADGTSSLLLSMAWVGVQSTWLFQYKRWNFLTKRLALKTYPREAHVQLFHLELAESWQRALIADSMTKHEAIQSSYSCTRITVKSG